MATSEIQKLQGGLRAARDEVLSAIDGITEQEAHQIPAPDEWSVAQLLAHIAEIQVFWVGKAALITKEGDLGAGAAGRRSSAAQRASKSEVSSP